MKIFTRLSKSLIPAFLLLFGAGITGSMAYAQATNETIIIKKPIVKSSDKGEVKKVIETKEVNSEQGYEVEVRKLILE